MINADIKQFSACIYMRVNSAYHPGQTFFFFFRPKNKNHTFLLIEFISRYIFVRKSTSTYVKILSLVFRHRKMLEKLFDLDLVMKVRESEVYFGFMLHFLLLM